MKSLISVIFFENGFKIEFLKDAVLTDDTLVIRKKHYICVTNILTKSISLSWGGVLKYEKDT